jgi:hypothetical protein
VLRTGAAFAVMALIVFCPAVAVGATVLPTGQVDVSRGQGFHRIDASTELAAGTQVMVRSGSSASIAYSKTCIVAVRSATVRRPSPFFADRPNKPEPDSN